MLEEDAAPWRDLTLENPIRAIREISHDITCRRRVRLANGRELSAVEIQAEYLTRALRFAKRRGLPPLETARARDVGTRDDPPRGGSAQADDRSRLGDQVPPDRGVPEARRPAAHAPARRRCSTSRTTTSRGPGRSTTCSNGAARSTASSPTTRSPTPSTRRRRRTRARLRGAFIKRAKERKRDYTVDWVHLKLNDQAQRTVLCKDPFKSRDERVERLIASPVSHRVPSFRAGAVVADPRGARRACSASRSTSATVRERAYVLTQLTGPVAVGDDVVVNTTAVELGLGTGGWHVVHWNLARREWSEPGAWSRHEAAVHEPAGRRRQHRGALARARRRRLDRRHAGRRRRAAQPARRPIAVAFKQRRPDARLVYVMTDGAALPLALSDLVAELRRRELVDATITCGHAFGGDYEAVSVYSALAVARQIARRRRGRRRDGTRHRRHRDPARLQRHRGRPRARRRRRARTARRSRACASRSPTRATRHRGVSHHSITTLTVATRSSRARPGPRRSAASRGAAPRRPRRRRASTAATRSSTSRRSASSTLLAARGLHVVSMGRPAADDPVLFELAAAAAVCAAERMHVPLACARCPTRRSRVERVLNLLALLLDTRRALTREEIVHDVAGYPPQITAYRRAFERDKETLRGMGVPLTTEIDRRRRRARLPRRPEDYYLPDLDLDAEESRGAARRGQRGLARQPARGRARS